MSLVVVVKAVGGIVLAADSRTTVHRINPDTREKREEYLDGSTKYTASVRLTKTYVQQFAVGYRYLRSDMMLQL